MKSAVGLDYYLKAIYFRLCGKKWFSTGLQWAYIKLSLEKGACIDNVTSSLLALVSKVSGKCVGRHIELLSIWTVQIVCSTLRPAVMLIKMNKSETKEF